MKIKSSILLLLSVALFPFVACVAACSVKDSGSDRDSSQPTAPSFRQKARQDYALANPNTIEAKNVYFLSLVNASAELTDAIAGDVELAALSKKKYEEFKAASTLKDKIASAVFSNAEITAAGKRISALWAEDNAFDRLAIDHLSPSGCYISNKSNTVPSFLEGVWATDAAALNTINRIFGDGSQAAHCDDDRRTASDREVLDALKEVEERVNVGSPFYQLALECAKAMLAVNERDGESVNFEPLNEGCNKAAFEAASTMEWGNYEYSVIMVPGAGPDDYDTALHPDGKIRCDIGYGLWKQKLAPFIMVSGGRIHPSKTKYCEAYEMKKYLMGKGVPESAIIMEPHARHTPTNVRNMVRVMFRMGIPMDMGGIVACTAGVISGTFQNQAFMNRCINEYGFLPVSFGKTVTSEAITFYPRTDCLNIFSKDPLDP